MITADQLLCHAIGDYILQSDWMAKYKTKGHGEAFCHALTYSSGFLLFQPTLIAWLVIFGTHFFIDRYRLARYVVWAKNWLGAKAWWGLSSEGWKEITPDVVQLWQAKESGRRHPDGPFSEGGIMENMIRKAYSEIKEARNLPFSVCSATGYAPDRPMWLAMWLMVIADNIIHVIVNGAALRWL